VNHVRPGLPPFLLINAENDLPSLSEMTEELQQALEGSGCVVQVLRVPGRNHNSIMFCAVVADDPVAQAILDFIDRIVAAQP
jgi:acetyl esterase/lipase